jgi:heptosyltransferase-2
MLNDDRLRRWQPEHYVTLAKLLLDYGIEVVLTGGPGDAWIQPLFAPLPVTDLIGQCTLPQTLALLDEADLLVTHDTGPLHLAGIARCSIVTIFGPTDPRGRLPQRPGTVALWGGEGFACRPCYDAHSFAPCPSNDCMSQVTPALVLAEIQTLLAARAANTLPPPRIVVPPSSVASVAFPLRPLC